MMAKAILTINGIDVDPFLVSWILTTLLFVAQLWLCFRGKQVWLRALPALPALLVFVLGLMTYLEVFGPGEFFGALIFGIILMICGGILAVGTGLGWVVYVITLLVRAFREIKK